MAVRIEFFTITGTLDFELVPPADLDAAVAAFDTGGAPAPGAVVTCAGWVSASDDDEERFGAWCEAIDDELGLGLLHQGVGEDAAVPVAAVGAVDGDGAGVETAWAGTLSGALTAAAGERLGWRTNFDVAGTSGTTDDYPSASHAAG